ncbi:MAG: cytochrome c [Candidatus Eremiobacteraeota bacterium]|nr:cytochrome c [Candidatus Eremiobacteraeota bacterium]
MLRGIFIGIVLTLAVLALGGYLAVTNGWVPANADARPGSLERWAASTSLDATVDREAGRLSSPIQATEPNLVAGAKAYGANCAVCHGLASGPGTNISRGFYQRAPSFTRPRSGVTRDPVEVTYWKITHGIRLTGMPSFAGTLDDTARWQIALFLKNKNQLPAAADKIWKAMRVTEALAPPVPDRSQGQPGPAK